METKGVSHHTDASMSRITSIQDEYPQDTKTGEGESIYMRTEIIRKFPKL